VIPSSDLRNNIRRLYADIFWFGVLSGSTLAFVSIFAARLGASGLQIGLLTAGPALVNLVFSLPAGRWLDGRPLIGATFWSALLQRLGYLAMIGLPLLMGSEGQILALILLTLVMSLPGTTLAIGFNALFADVVPDEWRAKVVGKRNAILAISLTGSTLLSGVLLDQIAFPLNYQIVFGVGAVGAGLSAYNLARLQYSQSQPQPPVKSSSAWRSLARFDLLRGRFGWFLTAYLLFYTFQYTCLPLFPLVYVNTLKLSDGMISLGNGLFYTAMFLVSLRLHSLATRFGHRRLLAAGAVLFAAYPLFLGLARGPGLYWVAMVSGGLIWGLVSASQLNRLMEMVPKENRAAGMTFHNVVLSLGILVGSLVGPLIGDAMGAQPAVLLGAGLRLLGGLLMIVWG
jgi:MFS family permease